MRTDRNNNPEPDPTPPACAPTAERIQAVLDGQLSPDALAADPHPAACPACRERVRAARLVLAALAEPCEPITVPAGLTNAILAGVRADRRARTRRRVLAYVGGFAAAAAIALAVWLNWPKPREVVHEMPPAPAPAPAPTPDPAPPPRPIRITDQLAKAGDALRDSTRAVAGPAAAPPKLFAALTDSLLKPPAAPVPIDLGPAGRSLSEIPAAARVGLEPVAGSAQKALSRLMRDVGAIQPKTGS